MNKLQRLFELHRILSQRRRPVSLQVICEEMDCSESTARRLVHALRDDMDAPLAYDRTYNGWCYDDHPGQRYELPGLWFTPDELYALMVSWQLLSELQPGLASHYIEPARDKIEQLLQQQGGTSADIGRRIRILQIAARPTDLKLFQRLSRALFERRRISVLYHGRERDKITTRDLSPQRLIYYRSNWYLDAWCHLRNNLRSFSLDRLHLVDTLGQTARECSDNSLDAHFTQTYGIFAGEPANTAVLRFTPDAARWVADEQWHPAQQGKVLKNGGFELRIPYSDPTELIMDILKYGPDVEVLRPKKLRDAVAARLSSAAAQYKK
ncbi:MAG TPA: WYL domain-containing protein [Gammaproteobacteria bacterium]|nr:WYL domain-containing protein [Gammaproteobacteria bacterium]